MYLHYPVDKRRVVSTREPSVPVSTVPGRPADEVAQLYRDDGFTVHVVDLDREPLPRAWFDIRTIYVVTRAGRVEYATRGRPERRTYFCEVQALVRESFDPEELAVLDAINLDPADEPSASSVLLNLVASWGWDVRIFAEQVDRDGGEPDPHRQVVYDVVGALFLRDRVEDAARRAPDQLRDRVRDVIEVFDAEYHAFTRHDADAEMIRLGEVRRFRAGWWWHRTPALGPIRGDLDAVSGRRTDPGTGEPVVADRR